MMVNLRTDKSVYFFSGDIYMNPDTVLEVNLNVLTDVQLLDIIENSKIKRIFVDDIESVKKALAAYGNSNPELAEDNIQIKKDLRTLKTTVDNLTVGQVSSEVFWSTSDW